MKIVPQNKPGSHRTGSIPSALTVEEISKALGFEPNVLDDPDKVKHSWGFKVNGVDCGIWDYNGGRWSTYGPLTVFMELFPNR
jgi:hypothetical protein